MAKDDKTIRKMRQSPKSIRFEELAAFLARRGFEGTPRGSHVQFRRADGMRFSVVRPHGKDKTVHPAAIREVLRELDL
jgi:predicted RNA binding protein YcfA (HicA-like mRNA interferase family)